MKKRSLSSLFVLLICVISYQSLYSSNVVDAWENLYPEIEKNIKAPVFPDKYYSITDFGAIANDSTILNTESINRAIAICHLNGGGYVVVPEGVWHTAPITLKSNVNLRIEKDAVLQFTTDPKYFSTVLTRWEGLDCYNHQPLIYAYGETNIGITGEGVIDGASNNDNWWKKCGAPRYGWKEGDISQKTGRPKLLKWSIENLPISERILTENDGMRPQTINLYRCNNVLIEGVKLLRSPFWVIHPLMCDNVIVRSVHIHNRGPNGDGCNPESSTNVLIENCFFDTGDDCIAIKSGRNNDGRFWSKPSENIIVRNCQMKNGHGGVVIGSEISGGFRNLFVENCKMDSPQLDRAIRIKTSTLRGGVIENIYVRDVEVGQCKEAVLRINLLYEQNEIGERNYIPTVRNVNLERVTCQSSRHGILINSLDEKDAYVYDVNLTDCDFTGVKSDHVKITGTTSQLKFNNLKINGKLIKN